MEHYVTFDELFEFVAMLSAVIGLTVSICKKRK